ncbi:MAG: hypothetical protein NE334_10120 [Lentisphaeraceae bacterium]|nr:hypothetical protein [Lentisphaeraceae bacterium]
MNYTIFKQVTICLLFSSIATQAGLKISVIGKEFTRNKQVTPPSLFFDDSNKGGSTSIRNADLPNMVWKDKGYYRRNRDLGQVFNIPAGQDITLDAIVLRTGNSRIAVLTGARNAEMYLQFYEVIGQPTINDNATPIGKEATHGFTKNHRGDDYIEGVTYKTICIVKGGHFPNIEPTTKNGGQAGHLLYTKWDLTGEDELTLKAGKRYAFMVGFVNPGPLRNLTFGNVNYAHLPQKPQLVKDSGGLHVWSFRREGDGSAPIKTAKMINKKTGKNYTKKELVDQSKFNEKRYDIQPTTDGYPDVDTYRSLEFYIELKK